MKWYIEGPRDFEAGDVLTIGRNVVAVVVERSGNLLLQCKDTLSTEIYCGKKGKEADTVIRTFLTTASLHW